MIKPDKHLYNLTVSSSDVIYPGKRGLERTKALLEAMGNPQNNFKSIHIAGTSGKGSTVSIIASILKEAGFKVGMHISPHTVTFYERFQINGEYITDDEYYPLVEKYTQKAHIVEQKYGKITFFEAMTAVALQYFSDKNVDYAVIETGLGGLHDATNVLHSEVSVITPIGLDHTRVLGETIGEIAVQKAGIIKSSNRAVVIGRQGAEARGVIREKAQELDVRIVEDGSDYRYRLHSDETHESSRLAFEFFDGQGEISNIQCGLQGLFQVQNAAAAIAAVHAVEKIDKEIVRRGVKKAQIPGRLELFQDADNEIFLDGAHNPDKMAALVEAMQSACPGEKFTCIVAFKKRKDVVQMAKILQPIISELIITEFDISALSKVKRAQSAADVQKMFIDSGYSGKIHIEGNPHGALQRSRKAKGSKRILITGSLYLVAAIRKMLID